MEEWHYYISSRELSAEELLRHARMEWAVETMHWLLDIHYGEDYCRIENRTIPKNLNLLHKFSISLLRQYKTRTTDISIRFIALSHALLYNKLQMIIHNATNIRH